MPYHQADSLVRLGVLTRLLTSGNGPTHHRVLAPGTSFIRLLIRGFGVRVPGGAPGATPGLNWAFRLTQDRSPVLARDLCPCSCPCRGLTLASSLHRRPPPASVKGLSRHPPAGPAASASGASGIRQRGQRHPPAGPVVPSPRVRRHRPAHGQG